MSLLSYSDVDTKLLGNSIKPPMYHPITIFLLRRHSLAKIYFLDSPIWFLPFNLWSTMVQSSHSAPPLAVKMSVPQNSLFSVFLRKYKLVAPLPDETATKAVAIPNSWRSNSDHTQCTLRVGSLPFHSLEICKLDRWEILMNTKEWVSDDKIQITILILRRGPCLTQRTLVHNYGQNKKGDSPFLADRCQKIVLGKLLIHKRGEDCLPLRCKKIRTSLISF